MPLTACTIQQVLSTDNPNEGRVKINNNFECLENTINELQVAANTGTTIVDAGTNIGVALSYSGSAPLYTVSVVSSPTFSSLSSATISTDGLVLNAIGTGTSILNLGLDSGGNVVSSTTASISSYWTSGSSGSYSIKADNDSGLDATGDYAVAEGAGSLASGAASHAEGDVTTAFGQSSHAEGSGSYASGATSHAEGNGTTSVGGGSHAEGTATTSLGNSSHAEGSATISTGNYSHAEGYQTISTGNYSHAEGNSSTSIGSISHAEGNTTTAIGDQAHSEGFLTIASGGSSHAEGRQTTAIGNYSHSEGYLTKATGTSAHAEGYSTSAVGDYSHAEGEYTTAIGQSSHAEGNYTTATGSFSHTEGSGNNSIGDYSHTEGLTTTAVGYSSHAEGESTQAIGDQSHAGGYNSISSGETSFIHSKNSLVAGARSVVLGGQNITGTTNDTVYVPYLNISNIGSGTPITSLAIDSSGNVVSGSSENANQVNLGPVLENTITTPPTSPEDQDRYIVPLGSSGEWSGQTNTIAEWSDADSMWGYYTATTGDRTIVTTGVNAGNVYEYSASSWVQISLSAPSSTPFYIGGTLTDAGSNKTSAIYRSGNVLIGGSSGTSSVYKFRVVGQSLLDGIATRTAFSSTNDTTRTNKWFKIFRYRFLSDTYSSETFKLMMTDSGNSNGSGNQAEFNVTIKKQTTSVYCSVLIDQKSKVYGNISDNFDVLYNNTTKELSFYYKPTQNYAASSWTVLSNRNYTLTGRFSWDNLYLSASTLSGETSDSATIEKKVVTHSIISSTGATTTHYGTLAIGDAPASGSTIDNVLLRSLDGSIKTISQSALTTSINLGRVLFVSTTGDDSTAEVGNIAKPWRNIYSAKSASTSGDTVYILPGTWTYDNRNSAGNPFNGQIETKVNLWKNGVTYYFMPGSKIVFYNQTVSGSDMYLFRPSGVTYETCTVLGHLEYEQNSTGADTSNGTNYYFYGTPISTDTGYTFYSETKTLKSNHCETIRITRSSSTSNVTRVTIKSDYEEWSYLGGQSASGSLYRFDHTGTDKFEFTSHVRLRVFPAGTNGYPFYCSSNSNATINIYGDQISNLNNGNLFLLRNQSGVINCGVKVIYYTTAFTPFGYFGSIVSTNNSGGWTMNMNGDLIDSAANSQTTGLFYLTTANNTLNFNGNITTNTNSGAGRFIAATTQPNTININGNINLIGTATTTNVLFQPNAGAIINYQGKITGNYGGPLIKTYNGTMNMNNSFVQITADNSNAQIFQNGGVSSGTCRINNSYVEMRNNSDALSNGSYVKALVNNSTIINTGTGTTLSNATNFGSLQLINSTIMTSGGTSISYISSGTPVIVSNSVSNANYNITNINGFFNVITELTY